MSRAVNDCRTYSAYFTDESAYIRTRLYARCIVILVIPDLDTMAQSPAALSLTAVSSEATSSTDLSFN